jgi:hypothetical protein
LKFGNEGLLKNHVNPSDPNDSTVAVSKFTERLGLTETGIRVFEDNDENK